MRKSLLKALAATAVVGATMAICSTSAFAAITTWDYEIDGLTGGDAETFGIGGLNVNADNSNKAKNETTAGTGNSISATFKKEVLAYKDGETVKYTNSVKGRTGINVYKGGSNDGAKFITLTPTEDGVMEVYVCRVSKGTSDFYVYEGNTGKGTVLATGEFARDTENMLPLSVTVKADETYSLYANGGDSALFKLRLLTGDDLPVYPAETAATLAESAVVGGTSTVYVDGIEVHEPAENNDGLESTNKIRLGKAVAGDSTKNVTSQQMGYITFPGASDDEFYVTIRTAATGTTARTYYFGTYDATTETFSDIEELKTPASQTPANTVVKVEGDNASTSKTYAIYLKNKGGTDQKANENVDVYGVSVTTGATETLTPALTLSEATLSDGKIILVGTFNDYAGYDVNKIILKAASAKYGVSSATWKEFDITKVRKENGVYAFTVKLKAPTVDAKYQAEADYVGNISLTSSVSGTAVSNVTNYTA